MSCNGFRGVVCCAPDNYRRTLDIDEESEFVEAIPIETVDVAVYGEGVDGSIHNFANGYLPPPGPRYHYNCISSVNGGSTISTRDYADVAMTTRTLEFSEHDRAAMISLGEVSFADHSGTASSSDHKSHPLTLIKDAISRGDWISVADQALRLESNSESSVSIDVGAPNGNGNRTRRVEFNVADAAELGHTLSDASSSSSFSTHLSMEEDESIAGSTYMTADDGEEAATTNTADGVSMLEQELTALRRSYQAKRCEVRGSDAKSDADSDEIEQLFNAIEWSIKKEKNQQLMMRLENVPRVLASSCTESEVLSMISRENSRLNNLQI